VWISPHFLLAGCSVSDNRCKGVRGKMALIKQQDVIHIVALTYKEVPEKITTYLENYPLVRIMNLQVVDTLQGIHIYLVVETV
jgi:hypothetical protein